MEIQRSCPRVRITEGGPVRADHCFSRTGCDRVPIWYGLGGGPLERTDRPWPAREVSYNTAPLYPALRRAKIKWADSAQEQYRSILRRSSDVVYVSRKYTQNCMLERNRYLVDHASILVAVYNGTQRSGTGATVRYAQKQGREIFIIDPISRTTTYFPMNSVRG